VPPSNPPIEAPPSRVTNSRLRIICNAPFAIEPSAIRGN
jgi:hypothetical protein